MLDKIIQSNRKAKHNYEILDRFEAGIVLRGYEVKALKTQGGSFEGSYVRFKNGELFLEHFNIPLYKKANLEHYEPLRSRKLLLHKKEISHLSGAVNNQGLSIVPLAFGLKNNKIKFEIALVRGKKAYDKRETIKRRDLDRRLRANLKNW